MSRKASPKRTSKSLKTVDLSAYNGLFAEWCAIEPSDCEFLEPVKSKKSPVKSRKSPVKKASPKKAVKKSPPKKSPVRKASPKKAVKKSPPKKSPVRKQVKKSPVRMNNRQSPPYHAADFKVGYQMEGVDGNMWKIISVNKSDGTKYNRWAKV